MTLRAVWLITVFLFASFANFSTANTKPNLVNQSHRYLRDNGNKILADTSRLTSVADTEERAPSQVITKVESTVQKTSAIAKLKSALPSFGLAKMKTLFQFQKKPAASKLTSFLAKKPSVSETKTFFKKNPDVTQLKVGTSTKVTTKDVKRVRPFFSRVFGNDSLLWDFLMYVLTPAVFLAVIIVLTVKLT